MCHISYWFWSWHMVLPCVLYSLFFNHFRNQALGGGLHVWVSRRSPSPSSARHNTYYFHSFSISIHTWPYSNPSWSVHVCPLCPPNLSFLLLLLLLLLSVCWDCGKHCSRGENSASAGNVFSNLATSLSFLCTTCAHQTHRLWRCEWWLTKEMMNNEANLMILKHWGSINWCDSSPNYI